MYAAIRRTLSFMSASERATYFALVIGRGLTGVLDVAGILLIGIVASIGASQLTGDGKPLRVLGIQFPALSGQDIVVLVLLVLGLFLVKAAIAVWLSHRLTRFIAKLEVKNAAIVAEYLLRSNLETVKRSSNADFQWAITGSTTYAFTGILNSVAILVTEGFLLVIIAATFFLVNQVAAVAALLYFALIIVLIQLVIRRNLKKAGVDAVEGTVDTLTAVSDSMASFREISVLEKQDHFLRRIDASRVRIADSGATMTFLAGMPRYVVETALMLGVVAFVAILFLSGQLATGFVTVGVFLAGGVRMMGSLLPVQNAIGSIRHNVEQARLAQDLISEANAAKVGRRERRELLESTRTRKAVKKDAGFPVAMKRVAYRYPGADRDALDDVSLTIGSGQFVAIIGPSGAGKTTLVDLMLGLVDPSAGSVTVDGVDPTVLRSGSPGAISYVPQQPGIVSGTLLENVALGEEPEAIDRTRAREAIDAAFLGEFIDARPDGLDSSVGAQVDSLSGGQIQRLGLARALYTRPRLLILDEATSALDASSESFISETLKQLHGSVTVVVIAHRLSTVQHADVVHVVEGGKIVASGDFKTVRKNVPLVAEYVKLMSFDEE